MRRIVHAHRRLLVIVLIVNEDCVLALKLERQPPVSAYADAPVALERSGQRVKFPSRSIQVARRFRIVEREQLQP